MCWSKVKSEDSTQPHTGLLVKRWRSSFISTTFTTPGSTGLSAIKCSAFCGQSSRYGGWRPAARPLSPFNLMRWDSDDSDTDDSTTRPPQRHSSKFKPKWKDSKSSRVEKNWRAPGKKHLPPSASPPSSISPVSRRNPPSSKATPDTPLGSASPPKLPARTPRYQRAVWMPKYPTRKVKRADTDSERAADSREHPPRSERTQYQRRPPSASKAGTGGQRSSTPVDDRSKNNERTTRQLAGERPPLTHPVTAAHSAPMKNPRGQEQQPPSASKAGTGGQRSSTPVDDRSKNNERTTRQLAGERPPLTHPVTAAHSAPMKNPRGQVTARNGSGTGRRAHANSGNGPYRQRFRNQHIPRFSGEPQNLSLRMRRVLQGLNFDEGRFQEAELIDDSEGVGEVSYSSCLNRLVTEINSDWINAYPTTSTSSETLGDHF